MNSWRRRRKLPQVMKSLAQYASASMKGERKSTDQNAGISSTNNVCLIGCSKVPVVRHAGTGICEGNDLKKKIFKMTLSDSIINYPGTFSDRKYDPQILISYFLALDVPLTMDLVFFHQAIFYCCLNVLLFIPQLMGSNNIECFLPS